MPVSPKQLRKLVKKCQKDPAFFINKFCKIEHPKAGIIPFTLFDYQIQSIRAYLTHKLNIYRKCRQCGISTLTGTFALWYAMFFKNKTILIVSKRERDAKDYLKKNVKLVYNNLPDWMKEIWSAVDNVHEIVFPNGSRITSLTSSPETLRSNASSLNIIDEAAFMPHMDDMWAGGWPTLQHGGSVIVISTTKGVGNWYWRFWTDAETGMNDFNPIVINWWDMTWKIKYWDELAKREIMIAPTHKLTKCKTAEEIEKYGPYRSPWLIREYRNLTEKDNDNKFRQEVLAEFIGTGNTVLSRQTISIIGNSVEQYGDDYQTVGEVEYVNPVSGERDSLDFRNDLWVWKKPIKPQFEETKSGEDVMVDPGHNYIMGCDTATGEGNDFSAIEVFDLNEGEQVAELKIKVRPKVFAKMIDYIGRWYCNATAVVENTGIGKATCQELYEDLSYPAMFRSRRKRADLKFKPGHLGFSTTGQSRNLLDKALIDGLGEGGYTVYSSRFHKEAMIYVQLTPTKTGAEPGPGNNDDLMLAGAMALIGIGDVIRTGNQALIPYHNMNVPLSQRSVSTDQSVQAGGGRDLLMPMGISSEAATGKQAAMHDEVAKFQHQIGGITVAKESKAKNNIETVKFKRNQLKFKKTR